MAYATTSDIQGRMTRQLSQSEVVICTNMLNDAAVLIDAYNADATADAKMVVSCNMVIRAMGDTYDVPVGATQGSMSALGYSQSWTMTNGATGELYMSRTDKKLLGASNQIGSYSPTQELVWEGWS